MTTRDPFERPSSQPDAWSPDAASTEQAGYAPPGPQAPAPQQPAPGFSAGAPASPPVPYGNPSPPPYGNPSPPPYGQMPPVTGPQSPSPTSTDGVSIAALVTGILGMGPVAVALGAVGLRRTGAGQRKGTWMAVIGLVLGVLVTIAVTAALTWGIAWTAFEADSAAAESEQAGSEYAEGSAYGDDPALDALWDDCAAGDNTACDDLYSESPLGSEYEEFGDSCGERGRPFLQTWCEEGRTW
ncbi:DUF4190 domain-containing protein [Demequina sp. SO4-13]|uniref:DUF4190 domain-containing protein n=1 Tax=Demequina sp. SO4-13 TaxID=3401027 RepID=UPI003AF74E0C